VLLNRRYLTPPTFWTNERKLSGYYSAEMKRYFKDDEIVKDCSCKLFLICFACIIAYGCVPAPYSYHQPSAPGGVLVHSFIDRHIGSKDTIEFKIGGVKTLVEGGDHWMSIVICIPEGKSIQLSSDEIGVYEDTPENAKQFKINRSAFIDLVGLKSKYVKVGPAELIDGPVEPAKVRYVEMSVELDKRTRDHFFVKLPQFHIGEQCYEFPIIEFVKQTGAGIFFING
jgi:hypothetical protein